MSWKTLDNVSHASYYCSQLSKTRSLTRSMSMSEVDTDTQNFILVSDTVVARGYYYSPAWARAALCIELQLVSYRWVILSC